MFLLVFLAHGLAKINDLSWEGRGTPSCGWFHGHGDPTNEAGLRHPDTPFGLDVPQRASKRPAVVDCNCYCTSSSMSGSSMEAKGAPVTSTAPGWDEPHHPTPCDFW